ncbi:MAG: corrinoid protein [Oscillospiraceae bacterium]|nr:corrinoid protein [Oscillospiraceae bacterium]
MQIFEEIKTQLTAGQADAVAQLVQQALDEGQGPKDILEGALLPAMDVVGEKFKNGNVFLPEVLIAARAMNAGTTVLRPLLVGENAEQKGVAVAGTVKGDMHDIGKNLVRMLMEGKGITVVDLGANVAPEKFLAAVKEHNADIVVCSALLSTTMGEMKNVVDLFEREGMRDKVKIMVGGAPVTQEFCDQIGADAYTPDAASAANWAAEYLESKKA